MTERRIIACDDLDREIAELTKAGARLLAIGPADAPTWAELSGVRITGTSTSDGTVILDAEPGGDPERFARAELEIPATVASLTISHETSEGGQDSGWTAGRAGMAYRDMIPDRYGGAYIASHIHVEAGGPVPDYVHYHDVAHQLIYCHRGWVRVVYQDQGPSFVMEAGDCVLQPPGCRHQVLETSPDLYVVELTSPANHRTSVDHDLNLPTGETVPGRFYGGGQRFVRHQGANRPWRITADETFSEQLTEIGSATGSLTEVRFIRFSEADDSSSLDLTHELDLVFLFVVSGSAELVDPEGDSLIDRLVEGSSVAVPPSYPLALRHLEPNTVLLEWKCRRP